MLLCYKYSKYLRSNAVLLKSNQDVLNQLVICNYCDKPHKINHNDQKNDKNVETKDTQTKNGKGGRPGKVKEYPEEPTTCCMSGCANCVWLEYAEKLSEYYRDGGEKAVKEINERISDPNLKAFLLHELRTRSKK